MLEDCLINTNAYYYIVEWCVPTSMVKIYNEFMPNVVADSQGEKPRSLCFQLQI